MGCACNIHVILFNILIFGVKIICCKHVLFGNSITGSFSEGTSSDSLVDACIHVTLLEKNGSLLHPKGFVPSEESFKILYRTLQQKFSVVLSLLLFSC